MRSVTGSVVFIMAVIFQPELRRAVGQIGRGGRSSFFGIRGFGKNTTDLNERVKKSISVVVDSALELQKMHMGALIVFEYETLLGDIASTGVVLNAEPTQQLLCNIFYNKAPLHDGAVIIREGYVYSAGCILPLSKSSTLDPDLGTRHRAAIGVTEDSDSIAVIISEENGIISVSRDGILIRSFGRESLKNTLESYLLEAAENDRSLKSFLMGVRKEKKNEKK
jgi:diadenylate cyclase